MLGFIYGPLSHSVERAQSAESVNLSQLSKTHRHWAWNPQGRTHTAFSLFVHAGYCRVCNLPNTECTAAAVSRYP